MADAYENWEYDVEFREYLQRQEQLKELALKQEKASQKKQREEDSKKAYEEWRRQKSRALSA